MQATIISSVFDLIAIASKYGGVVYGGFVRDIIVPLIKVNNNSSQVLSLQDLGNAPSLIETFKKNEALFQRLKEWSTNQDLYSQSGSDQWPRLPTDLWFKDLDLWFKSRAEAEKFVTAMDGALTPNTPNNPESNSFYVWEAMRMKYWVKSTPSFGLWKSWFVPVELICSETYPVNDFDVNCLAFTIVDNHWHSTVMRPDSSQGVFRNIGERLNDTEPKSYVNISAQTISLVESIMKKEVTMLDSYMETMARFTDYHYRHGTSPSIHPVNRIERRYIARGWTVKVPGCDTDFTLANQYDLAPYLKRIARERTRVTILPASQAAVSKQSTPIPVK